MTTTAKQVHAIKGTTFWCNHAKPSKFGGYGVDLGRLDEKTVKGLKALGIPVKFDTENEEGTEAFKGFFVKLKNDAPVTAKDMNGDALPSQLNIGNGSKVWAALRAKPWMHKDTGRSGVRGVLLGLKVIELVEFDPEAANRAKADEVLDGISGEGFVFTGGKDSGKETEDSGPDQEDIDALFGTE